MIKSIMLAVAGLLPFGLAQAGLFGPSNYDECVLDGVKDAKTDMAARLVAQACRNKFPVKTEPIEQRRWIEVGFYRIGSTGLRNHLTDKLSILEIKSDKDLYGSRVSKVKVMNGYTFPVHNISMGIIKKSEKSKYWRVS